MYQDFIFLDSYPLYTMDEERDMFTKYISETDEERKKAIKDDIVLHNTKLALKIANNFSSDKLAADELFSYAVEGLIKAVENFDLSKGNKFSTFAYSYITKYVRKGWHENSIVAYPEYIWEGIVKFATAREEFIKTYGRTPTYKPCFVDDDFEELSEMEALLVKPDNNRLTHSAYKKIIQVWENKSIASLDDPIGDSKDNSDERTYLDCLESTEVKSSTDWISIELRNQINELRKKEDGEIIASVLSFKLQGWSLQKASEKLNISFAETKSFYLKGLRILSGSQILKDLAAEI